MTRSYCRELKSCGHCETMEHPAHHVFRRNLSLVNKTELITAIAADTSLSKEMLAAHSIQHLKT